MNQNENSDFIDDIRDDSNEQRVSFEYSHKNVELDPDEEASNCIDRFTAFVIYDWLSF